MAKNLTASRTNGTADPLPPDLADRQRVLGRVEREVDAEPDRVVRRLQAERQCGRVIDRHRRRSLHRQSARGARQLRIALGRWGRRGQVFEGPLARRDTEIVAAGGEARIAHAANLAAPVCDKPKCLPGREAALLARNLVAGFAGLLLVTSGALAQPADDDGKPNALSTLLPHQKDRVLCYASSGAPVTYPIEDLPQEIAYPRDPALRGRGPGGGLPGPPEPPGSEDVRSVSIFVAVREQLGLKLDAQHAPVDVLVIDSAEQPTEN